MKRAPNRPVKQIVATAKARAAKQQCPRCKALEAEIASLRDKLARAGTA